MTERVLRYDRPASEWTEALPVGNGRLGAMVYGGAATERLQLNEDTLWSGGPYDPINPAAAEALPRVRDLLAQGRYLEADQLTDRGVMARPLKQAAYSTLGDLVIAFDGVADDGESRRSLDLATALASSEVVTDGVTHRRRVVASPGDQVIAVHLAASAPGAVSARLSFACPLTDARAVAEGSELVLAGRNDPHEQTPGALTFTARVRAVSTGGAVRAAGEVLVIEGADEVTLLIAIATSYVGPGDLSGDPTAVTAEQVATAARRGFEAIAADVAAAHGALFDRLHLDLGPDSDLPTDERLRRNETEDDPALAALYLDYARYLLICSSRPGTQPANLQGIWNPHTAPPWGSKYTVNINTEMNYWPAEPAALPELVEPLDRLVREIAVSGERTAREMYGARGWVCHHNTDLWRATAPIDGARWGMWPTGGAWLTLHLWDRYRYAPDAAYLASIYPLLRGACEFFLDTLVVDEATGALVTSPSISPENEHHHGTSLVAGPVMDAQILRDLFGATTEAAETLEVDPALVEEIRAAAQRLPPNRVGSHGQLQEWQQDWDAQAPEQQHRHVSHLYGLYPSRQISPDGTPALAAAARVSLQDRGDESTGWATAWRIALWARLRDGDHAHQVLRLLLDTRRTYPNLLDAHPPFQIDGNFGGAAAILEMLVQTDGETIHLLPALPGAWRNGRLRGIRTPGPCTLDLAWADGRLTQASITGERAGERTIRFGTTSVTVALDPGSAVEIPLTA
ncbi:glycoside hydrolase family 95 protein [Pseudactinotalea suaedae]|uniref:glycoside hydrolase family 95 protein n=1 Tax=Pseudactinotalea suaedae TaxID=1524924 RepID=UPI0012E10A73|nr:glycoside hydrolase family 95 protein [Pseudactinotalea suaedae]